MSLECVEVVGQPLCVDTFGYMNQCLDIGVDGLHGFVCRIDELDERSGVSSFVPQHALIDFVAYLHPFQLMGQVHVTHGCRGVRLDGCNQSVERIVGP